jgi:multidrug efflux pump subunit AcrA (membrane-fusion protein)
MAAADAICTGTCNTTPQSVVQGLVKPDPLYFLNPATGEILECPPENVADIRQEAELLSKLADDLLRSGEQVYAATQALQAAEASADAAQKQATQKALEQATAAQEKAREAMFKEFKV